MGRLEAPEVEIAIGHASRNIWTPRVVILFTGNTETVFENCPIVMLLWAFCIEVIPCVF